MSKKGNLRKQIERDRESISKFAFGIVMALCVEILVYLVLVNIIPFSFEKPLIITTADSGYEFHLSGDTYYGVHIGEDKEIEFLLINEEPFYSYRTVKKYCQVNDLEINRELYLFEDVSEFYKEEWPTYLGYDNNNDGKISNDEWGAEPSGNALSAYSNDKKIDNGMAFIFGYNMVLLVATCIAVLWYLFTFLDANDYSIKGALKEFFKKNKGLLFLLIFMILALISSLIAYDPHRSFIGCYNLRDGYLSFMFYGSMLVAMLLTGNKENYKKIIVNTFLITATILTVLTIGDYYEKLILGDNVFPVVKSHSVSTVGLSMLNETAYSKNSPSIPYILSGIFNNTNHYAYYLTIAITAAAIMMITDKSIERKTLYFISFTIMTYMLILNDTFGSYLGVMIALIAMAVCYLIKNIKTVKKLDSENDESNANLERYHSRLSNISIAALVIVFIVESFLTTNLEGKIIVKKNFDDLGAGVSSIIASLQKDENDLNVEVSGENASGEVVSGDVISGETVSGDIQSGEVLVGEVINSGNDETTPSTGLLVDEAAEAGSGRWGIWLNTLKVIKRYPVFGCGLENMLYKMIDIVQEAGKGNAEGRSHNLVLQLAATVGIPAMLCYFIGMAIIFFSLVKKIKIWDVYAALGAFVMIAYLISSMTGNSGFYTSGYFYIFVGLAVLEIMKKEDTQEPTKVKTKSTKK